jgi:hypothetical protein
LTGAITINSVKVSKSSNWQTQLTTVPARETVLFGGSLFGSIATAEVRYAVTYRKLEPSDAAVATGEVVLRNTGATAMELSSVGVQINEGTVSSTSCGKLLLAVVNSEEGGSEETGPEAARRTPSGNSSATRSALQVPGGGTLKCTFSLNAPSSSSTLGVVVKQAAERGQLVQVSLAKPLLSLGTGGQTLRAQFQEDTSDCVTVGFEFMKTGVGEDAAASRRLVWMPDKVSGAVPPAAAVAAAGGGERICSSKEYRFRAVFGPVKGRRCGTYQVREAWHGRCYKGAGVVAQGRCGE